MLSSNLTKAKYSCYNCAPQAAENLPEAIKNESPRGYRITRREAASEWSPQPAGLTGANTYTGATIVEGGTLTLAGASGQLTGTSAVTVEGGASLVLGDSNGVTNRINPSANLTLGGSYVDPTTPSLNGTLIVSKASSGNNNQTLNSRNAGAEKKRLHNGYQ